MANTVISHVHAAKKVEGINILQGNVARRAASHNIAQVVGKKLKCNFLCLQEPNKGMSRLKNSKVYPSSQPYYNSAIIANDASQKSGHVYSVESFKVFVCLELKSMFIYSVYISPNCSMEEFRESLDALMLHVTQTVQIKKLPVILSGDFNAKNTVWGGKVTDQRGIMLLSAITAIGLTVINDSKHATLIRPNGESFIDLAIVSEDIIKMGVKWTLLTEEETLSDHLFAKIEIGQSRQPNRITYVERADPEALKINLQKLTQMHTITNPDKTVAEIQKVYRTSCRSIRADENFQLPFWWDEDIASKIECTKRARRQLQRETRNETRREELKVEYRTKRSDLSKTIQTAKKNKWRATLAALEEDIFGQAYNIVRAQLKCAGPRTWLKPEEKTKLFHELFITTNVGNLPEIAGSNRTEDVSDQELEYAINRIKIGKSPGPDQMLPLHVKSMIRQEKEFFKRLFSECFRKGCFPEKWKQAKLILIEKPRREGDHETKYRPICLLDVLGKVLETLVNERLKREIVRTGGFNENQFGFRSGCSTTDAIQKIKNTVDNNRDQIVSLVCIDVRNAFNTANWALIIQKIKKRGIHPNLIMMTASYFKDRSILLSRKESRQVTAGVPQGSVLGPTCWNILYDDVMDACKTAHIEPICYADDLALLVKTRTIEETNAHGSHALEVVRSWMLCNKLEIAAEKTAAIVFAWSYKVRRGVRFQVGIRTITPSKTVKYLGVVLDYRMRFSDHIKYVVKKSENTLKLLQILFPNVGGPTAIKRRVMAAALQSILLYASPVWAGEAMKFECNQQMLGASQRKAALRVCSAYHTVSKKAACVLAKMPPIAMLAEERARLHGRLKNLAVTEETRNTMMREERSRTMQAWQQLWDEDEGGETAGWTRTLIKDIRTWCECNHGDIGYAVTQFITGHGCFGAYLHKYKRRDTPRCFYGDADVDTPAHMLFECARFARARTNTELAVGQSLNVETLIPTMLSSEGNWKEVASMMEKMIRIKEREDSGRLE